MADDIGVFRPTRAQKRYMVGGKFIGRRLALFADEKTLAQLASLGAIQCTTRETASVLGVSHDTLMEFFNDCPEARALYEDGKERGRVSLRRKQMAVALSGNPTMLIWTGKQYLGQADKAEVAATLSLEALVLGGMASETAKDEAERMIEENDRVSGATA